MKHLLVAICLLALARAAETLPALPPSPTHLNFIAPEPIPLAVVAEGDKVYLDASIPVLPLVANVTYLPRKLQLTAKGIDPASLDRALTSLTLALDAQRGAAIKVRIDAQELRAAGTVPPEKKPEAKADAKAAALRFARTPIEYLLLLEVHQAPREGTPPPAPQLRFVRLRLPPATLAAPPSYAARQILPFSGPAIPMFPPLQVRETQQETRIADLTVNDVTRLTTTTSVDAGKLTCTGFKRTGRDGQVLEIALGTNDRFPLGDNAGRIELEAPELSASVSLPYTVRAVRPSVYIIWFALLGLALGLAIRVGLGFRKTLLEARYPADLLLGRIAELKKSHPDGTLLAALDTIASELRTARARLDPAEIGRAVTKANQDLSTAMATYKTDIAEAKQQLATLQTSLQEEWPFPPTARDNLRAIAADLKPALDKLQAGDATGAKDGARQAVGKFVALEADARTWHDNVLAAFKTLLPPKAPLPTAASGEITTASTFNAPSASVLRPNSKPQEVAEWLAAWSDSYRGARHAADRLATGISQILRDWSRLLNPVPRTRDVAAQIEAVTESLITALESAADSPAQAQAELATRLRELEVALRQMAHLMPEVGRSEVLRLVESREIAMAVQTVVRALDDQGQHLGDAIAPTDNLAFLFAVAAAARPPPRDVLVAAPGSTALPEPIAPHASTVLGLLLIKLVQTLAAAAIYLATVYFSTEAAFVGTPRELFVIAFGAFVWDLGFEATLQNAKVK